MPVLKEVEFVVRKGKFKFNFFYRDLTYFARLLLSSRELRLFNLILLLVGSANYLSGYSILLVVTVICL